MLLSSPGLLDNHVLERDGPRHPLRSTSRRFRVLVRFIFEFILSSSNCSPFIIDKFETVVAGWDDLKIDIIKTSRFQTIQAEHYRRKHSSTNANTNQVTFDTCMVCKSINLINQIYSSIQNTLLQISSYSWMKGYWLRMLKHVKALGKKHQQNN